MPIEIDVPDFGIVEFPDGMSVPEMEAAILTKLHQEPKRKALAAEKQDLIQQGKASAMAIPLLSGMEAGTKLVSKMDPLEAIAQAPLTVGRALGLNEPEHWESPIKPEDIIGSEQSDDVTQGLKQAAAEFISGSTSLEGAAGLALGARYPQAIGRVFQTEAIRNLPAAIQRLREAETTKEKVAAGAGVAANVAIPGLLQHGLQPKPGPVPPPYRGTALEMPRGAAKPRVEWMEEAPGVEIDNPTVTPTFPNRSLERRPLVEEAIENLPNAKPLTEGAPNALQPESAQVLRTLQEKPIEGEGQVSVAGDVVEAGQPRSEAQLPTEESVAPSITSLSKAKGKYETGLQLKSGKIINQSELFSPEEIKQAGDDLDAITHDKVEKRAVEKKLISLKELLGAKRGFINKEGKFFNLLDVAREEMKPRAEAPVEPAIRPAATTEEVLGTKPAEPPPADVVPAPPAAGELPKGVTSIKNAVVDKERVDRGLPPLMDAARRELDVAWDEAMSKIEGDPSYPERLVEDLAKNRRPITDTEVSALLHRKIELHHEHSKASQQLVDAADSGNSVAYSDAKSRLSDVSDKLLQLDEVGKAVGTEQSRGLNARKILADEDFTRVKMEIDRRVARGGGRLSPSEMTEIVRMQEIIAKTQAAYEKATQRITDLEVAKLASEASKGSKMDPGTQALVDRIIVGLDKEASAARNRIKARSEELRFSAGPLGELPNIKDYAIIGASHIVKGAVEFSRWSAEMVKEFGKGIEPHLKSIFEASNKHLDEKAASPTVAGKPVAKAVADKSAAALKAYKTRMKNQREEYDRRITEKDFSQKVRRKIALDPEAVRLKYANDKAKAAWNDLLFKEKLHQRTKLQKVFGGIGEAANTSRSIMTSLDLSAVLRQGGFISMAHPIRAAKAFPDMFRAMGLTPGTTLAGAKAAMAELVRGHPIRAAIEGVKTMGELGRMSEHAINVEIMSRENYPLYKQSNLYLSEHGKSLSKMEEVYMSRWADKIPMVAGSQRAYTTFLNRLRADSFDAMVKGLSKDGNIDSAQANAISNFINVSTGRGIYGEHSKNVESAMNVLNTVFFAPRYVTSRFQVLAGQPFYKGGKGTRKMIAGEYGRFLLGVGVVYALAEAAGASVNYTDPTKSDFTKIRFGNTLMDPMAGLQQQTVFTSREAEQLIKTIRGEKRKWNEKNGAQILGKYLRTKLAPVPGAIVDLSTGSNVAGEPVTLTSAATGLVTPIQVEDILEAMQEQGIPRGIGLGLLSMMGVGMQTYSQVKKK